MIALSLPGGQVLFTGREHGDIRDPAHAARLAEEAGRPLALGRQVHGDHVHAVTAPTEERVDADGQATDHVHVAPAVLVADCLPIAIVGDGALAVVHAGWRGLLAGVVEKGVATVRRLGGGEQLSAAIGPGAGPCCYVVGDDLRQRFGTTAPTLDLKDVARRRLNAAGIDHVEDAGVCTVCDSRYFSYRRDGEAAGRQAGVAWLTA